MNSMYLELTKFAESQIVAGNYIAIKQWFDLGGYRDYMKMVSFLRTSCQRGHADIVDLLLTPDMVTYLTKNKPIATTAWVNVFLNLGCIQGHLKIVKCLVERIGTQNLLMIRGLEIASSSTNCPYESKNISHSSIILNIDFRAKSSYTWKGEPGFRV